MKLSIIIPAYNEEKSIQDIISKVKKIKLPWEKEIIVVDDYSKDSTKAILKKIRGIKIFSHKINQGKGAAMRTGASKATGDYVIWQDADLEYNPEDIKKILNRAIKNKLGVVYGSRALEQKNKYSYLSYYLGNKLLNIVTKILYLSRITDMETGYKVFKKEVIKDIDIKSKGFTVEPELTAKIFKKKLRVYELPISYYGRDYSEGKKIKWYHAFSAIWALIKYKFVD